MNAEIAVFSGDVTFSSAVGDDTPVTSETTAMNTGTYRAVGEVTVNERINISGDVTLILGEGATLTASKGFEVSIGNKLTIELSGTLNATGTEINKISK